MKIPSKNILLTPSGTSALELCTAAIDLRMGDRVLMPSWTFSSSANAVVMRGATPIFADIELDTLNIDPGFFSAQETARIDAAMVVHYGGIVCPMWTIRSMFPSSKPIIEDAAQAVYSRDSHGSYAGCLGDVGAFSFHATKNISCGEGGAFITGNPDYLKRAEIYREKGTNRSEFLRGETDNYTWRALGSHCLMSEISAAVLEAQLTVIDQLTKNRAHLWSIYHECLQDLVAREWIRIPIPDPKVRHNAHIFWILTRNSEDRATLKRYMAERGFELTTHFQPLHTSPMGRNCGKTIGPLPNTMRAAETLLRLPLHWAVTTDNAYSIVQAIHDYYRP